METPEQARKHYRRTKIIFTVGPATESEETLSELIRGGVDVCRINMAHATHDWTRTILQRICNVSEKVGREIATLMDIKGPEIRTGALEEPFQLVKDEVFDFTVEGAKTEEGVRAVSVNYPDLISDVAVGGTVLVDNGLIHLQVESCLDDRLRLSIAEIEMVG